MNSLAVKGNINWQRSPAWGDSRGHGCAGPLARRHLAVYTKSCTLRKFKTKIQFLANTTPMPYYPNIPCDPTRTLHWPSHCSSSAR